jgi:hypothetical protein
LDTADLMQDISSGYLFLGISNNREFIGQINKHKYLKEVPLHEATWKLILLANERIDPMEQTF